MALISKFSSIDGSIFELVIEAVPGEWQVVDKYVTFQCLHAVFYIYKHVLHLASLLK